MISPSIISQKSKKTNYVRLYINNNNKYVVESYIHGSFSKVEYTYKAKAEAAYKNEYDYLMN